VHFEDFPAFEATKRDETLEQRVDRWLALRAAVYQQAVEPARQAKTVAKSLEATVTLTVPADEIAALEVDRAELEEFFIVSALRLEAGETVGATAEKSSDPSCARCWRFLPTVGLDATQPELCDRCAAAVLTCVPA
jgi:isoleucyl-tRNA synthetase